MVIARCDVTQTEAVCLPTVLVYTYNQLEAAQWQQRMWLEVCVLQFSTDIKYCRVGRSIQVTKCGNITFIIPCIVLESYKSLYFNFSQNQPQYCPQSTAQYTCLQLLQILINLIRKLSGTNMFDVGKARALHWGEVLSFTKWSVSVEYRWRLA